MKVSIIIPAFNEEKTLGDCLESLLGQTYKDCEIIVIDDGSTDETTKIAKKFNCILYSQNHLGPGKARNLGASKAGGQILVFVDADMTFDKDFIRKLVEPIIKNKTVGTFSKEEYVQNKTNSWSRAWNINKGLPQDKMHPKDYPDEQPVFRAILKDMFLKAGGFSPIGYVDDYTISEKLGIQAKAAPGAIFYHRNPETFEEIFHQARWIGKSEFKRRKIRDENLMRLISIIRYSLPLSLFFGLVKAYKYKFPFYLMFKIIYDFAIEVSLIKSFFGEQKYK